MNIGLKGIIDFYSSNSELGVSNMEIRMLEIVYDIEIWNNLSDYDKQKKRREFIKWNKTKFGNEDYKSIKYEESVLLLIDQILEFLQETKGIFSNFHDLENFNEIHLNLFRLRNMLYCEKEMVNRLPKIKQIGHVPLEIIQPIFQKIQGSILYENYNLGTLFNRYKETMELLSSTPY